MPHERLPEIPINTLEDFKRLILKKETNENILVIKGNEHPEERIPFYKPNPVTEQELKRRCIAAIKNQLWADWAAGGIHSEWGLAIRAIQIYDQILAFIKEAGMMTREEVFELLLAHKEYQRRWKGGLQILFGFSPDELNALRR